MVTCALIFSFYFFEKWLWRVYRRNVRAFCAAFRMPSRYAKLNKTLQYAACYYTHDFIVRKLLYYNSHLNVIIYLRSLPGVGVRI